MKNQVLQKLQKTEYRINCFIIVTENKLKLKIQFFDGENYISIFRYETSKNNFNEEKHK